MLACSLENAYTWFSHQDLPLYSSRMDANDNFGILDHNPNAFYDSLAQLQAQMDSQYPLLLVLSIETLRGVCNHKNLKPHYLVWYTKLIGTVFLL